MHNGIVFSQDQNLIETFFDVCSEVGVGLIKQTDFTNFIFELQQDAIDLIIFDSDSVNNAVLKHIQIIRRLKPKTPLIVISGNVEKIDGAKIYEEGIFHIAQKPIYNNNMIEILAALIKTLKSKV